VWWLRHYCGGGGGVIDVDIGDHVVVIVQEWKWGDTVL
jgi:hypothetical protein